MGPRETPDGMELFRHTIDSVKTYAVSSALSGRLDTVETRWIRLCCAPIACLALLLSGCAAHEAKDAARSFSASALEQVFLLTVFGSDALDGYNEDKHREWYWSTTPYRNSFTRETYLEMLERQEFEELYESLMETPCCRPQHRDVQSE